MPGTVIYLHGANDAGFGFVTRSCRPEVGRIAQACAAHQFTLKHPIAWGNPLPVAWHRDPLLHEIRGILDTGEPPFYLAGHSLGGRGALLIALRDALGERIRAVGAIAPALGSGLDAIPLVQPLWGLGGGFTADPFSIADLTVALAGSAKPVFIGYSAFDLVVGLSSANIGALHNPAANRIVQDYGVTPPPLDPHNALIDRTASDLMAFFATH